MGLRGVLGILLCALALPAAGAERRFEFTYQVTVTGIPAGAHRVRVWLPLASSDDHQTVSVKRISGAAPTRITRETEYGNRMVYAEIQDPGAATAVFTVEYAVIRHEYVRGDYQRLLRYNRASAGGPASLSRFLAPDRLVPVDGRMRELSVENTQGKHGPVEKAHALYEYLFTNFRYDKSGNGWGRGDSLWACDAKRGNCTDFHSPFISMLRAQKIPARFDIGFPLPAAHGVGEIPGYHCWAEFYVGGAGWIPVDISEAWKDKAKHDYFFGSVDSDRVQLSSGRDITLEPRQDGPQLNYFVYPYVEVDGRVHEAVEKKFSYRDLVAGGAATAAER